MAQETKEQQTAEDNVEARMTFTEHLGELRTRLVRSAIAVAAGIILCYAFSDSLVRLLARPLATLQEEGMFEEGTEEPDTGEASAGNSGPWVSLNPLEPVLVKLKVSAYGGLLVSLPYLLFHICSFIFPGLTATERRVARLLMFGGSALALCGAAVAYFGVFPLVLPYLLEWAPGFVTIQLRYNETLSLILKGLLGFAVAFQFPMAVLVLVYMGLLTPETLKQYRKVAIVGIFVVGALLTPPDPFSMCMMAAPLVVLYEMSIWASYLVLRRKKAAAEASSEGRKT